MGGILGQWDHFRGRPPTPDFESSLPVIKIPIFFKFEPKFVKIWQKKILKFFYLINVQMSPKFDANFAIKIFLGVILLFFDKILLEFQILWKSDHFWPKFTNKKAFLFSKIFWIFFLSNRMSKVVIYTMPFPEKNYGARNPFIIIGCLKLSILCATIKIDQFYEISAKICQNLAEKISKKFSIINEPIFT